MKKLILFAVIFEFTLFNLNAQNIGINATGAAPAASAGLDIDFTNKGLLVPRVALTAANLTGPIAGPTTSLLVYNTATAGAAPNNVTPGYYYWGGAAWVRVSTGGDDWKITGNANTTFGTHFLGTTNAQGLDFRTNNIIRLRIPNANQIHANSIGTAALPFYSWAGDPNTGMSNLAADQLNWSTGGAERLQLTNTQLATTFNGTAATPAYSWTTDPNTGMYRIGVDILGFSTTGVERMRIIANGNTGIGIAPTQRLHVAGGNFRLDGAFMPNNLAGTSGQALLSAGAGIAPTWGVNLTGLNEISRWYYPPMNVNANTTYTLTAIIPGVTSTSSAFVNLVGDWGVSPAANITIHHVECRTGQVRFIVRNSSGGTSYTGMDFLITVIR